MNNRISSLKKKKRIPFWAENPNVLFQTAYITEFFPVDYMTYEQKLNAVSRTVIVLTIISFAYSQKIQLLGICALSLFLIFLMFYFHKQNSEKHVSFDLKEGFDGAPDPKYFDVPNSGNPVSNVMLPDYDYNPGKKPAPPAFTKYGGDMILQNAKKMVQEANPDQPNIADKLFNSLGEELQFEQSLRPFHSNPGTTIPNDQSAFADFCYGSMVSCKEGNMFACARDNTRYNNY